jgi:hypothetical protein
MYRKNVEPACDNAGETSVESGGHVAERMDVQRLIVLVPDEGADGVNLARKIWALAAPCELSVLFVRFLGMEKDDSGAARDAESRESAARLRLATLAALVRDEHVQVETSIIPGPGWVNALRQLCCPGDLVLCCVEQTVPTTASGRQPLHQALSWVLDVPVFVLTGLYGEPRLLEDRTPRALPRVLFWSVTVAIVAVFFALQVQVNTQAVGLMRILLLVCSAFVELGAIALWSAIA